MTESISGPRAIRPLSVIKPIRPIKKEPDVRKRKQNRESGADDAPLDDDDEQPIIDEYV